MFSGQIKLTGLAEALRKVGNIPPSLLSGHGAVDAAVAARVYHRKEPAHADSLERSFSRLLKNSVLDAVWGT